VKGKIRLAPEKLIFASNREICGYVELMKGRAH